MQILFLHQNFPGQFLHIADALHKSGQHDVRAISARSSQMQDVVPTTRYAFDERSAARSHPLLDNYVLRVARAAAVTKTMARLKSEGFSPDVVVGHPGWGETLFVKDIWPSAKTIIHAEWYYEHRGSDTDFDPEFRDESIENRMRIRALNAAILLAVASADVLVAPTSWQASRFPAFIRSRLSVVHEGVDTAYARPSKDAFVKLASGIELRAEDEVLTFLARNLEPYRGFHQFMRALPDILRARPKARAVIVGADGVSYGAPPPQGKTWRQIFVEEVKDRLPADRVHFVGRVPHNLFINLMQISSAHVYLTYPFVLSWSMIEAMSAGALVIGSKTPPVAEVIKDGENGLLVPFFDRSALVERSVEALANPSRFDDIRARARNTIVQRYDLNSVCLPAWRGLVEGVETNASKEGT